MILKTDAQGSQIVGMLDTFAVDKTNPGCWVTLRRLRDRTVSGAMTPPRWRGRCGIKLFLVWCLCSMGEGTTLIVYG
jgi:hypothetical protein